MRVALYLRVSSEEQAREGFSIAAQHRALRAFCTSQGWAVAASFADEGYSGKDLRRPALTRLIAGARGGRFDVVLIWRLDRLSRRQSHTLRLIEDILAPAGVGLRSATEAFDTTTAAGKAMVGMLAVFAQLERESIIERTKLGLRERTRQGKWAGAAPWGYRYGEDGGLAPDPEAAAWVTALFLRAADPGQAGGPASLAAWLHSRGAPPPRAGGRWWPGTVRLILENRAYLGERRQGEGWIPSSHPPLVDAAAFAAAQDGLGRRPPRAPGYLLAGIGFCAHCGGRLRGKRQRWPNGRHRRYYICQERGVGCAFGWQAAERVDAAVLEAVGSLQPAGGCRPVSRPRLDAALQAGRRRLARLLHAVEEGWLSGPEVAVRLQALREERAALEDDLRAAPTAPPHQTPFVLDFPSLARFAAPPARQALLRALVARVTVARGAAVALAFRPPE